MRISIFCQWLAGKVGQFVLLHSGFIFWKKKRIYSGCSFLILCHPCLSCSPNMYALEERFNSLLILILIHRWPIGKHFNPISHSIICVWLQRGKIKRRKISAYTDGGPRSRVCTRLTLRSGPHQQQWKFFGACVCKVAFKHLPQPLRSHIRSFGTLGQLFKLSKTNI